jgi:transposase-like protein
VRNTQSTKQAGSRRHRADVATEVILEEYRNSGLTQRVFAQEAGIGVSTLQLWLRQARLGVGSKPRQASRPLTASAVCLLEVELGGNTPRSSGDVARYEIELGNGTRLRLPLGFEDAPVRRLLGLLKEVR